LADCRALASPDIVILLVGNKSDSSRPQGNLNGDVRAFANDFQGGEVGGFRREREVSVEEAGRWASREGLPLLPFPFHCQKLTCILGIAFLEASALEGANVEEAFLRCARQILTKVELGSFSGG
jgi:GTPase SAR1 family protein